MMESQMTESMTPGPIAVALDAPDLETALRWAEAVGPHVSTVKIGLELYLRDGADAVRKAHEMSGGRDIFLDLKLHDIPETVARAVQSARRIEAELLTVHVSGGYEMLTRAAQAAEGNVKLLGVTVLTSLAQDDLRAEGIEATIPEMVRSRARIAAKAGIAGLVCSSHEIEAARGAAPGLFIVVPGIRPATGPGAAPDDQKRFATPELAIRNGADYLVVGRPLRDAPEPAKAFEALVGEVSATLS
jgi:orotidine-5'-phosphate decarboxylase